MYFLQLTNTLVLFEKCTDGVTDAEQDETSRISNMNFILEICASVDYENLKRSV
jgi:hypothetical protein